MCIRAVAGPWNSLIFSRFSRPGKSLKSSVRRFHFGEVGVLAVQGHPRSPILVVNLDIMAQVSISTAWPGDNVTAYSYSEHKKHSVDEYCFLRQWRQLADLADQLASWQCTVASFYCERRIFCFSFGCNSFPLFSKYAFRKLDVVTRVLCH